MANLSSKIYNGLLPISAGGTGVTTTSAALTALGAHPTLISGTNIKTINGASVLGSGNLYIKCLLPTSVISSSYTAAAYTIIRCSSVDRPFTITLPASLADGDTICVLDISGWFNTNPVTVISVGSTIENDTSIILNIPYACVTFVYEISTTNWVLGNKSSLLSIAAPNPPVDVLASISLKTATISFTAPAVNGGSSITGYTATSSPGGLTSTTTPPSTSIIISNLLPSTTYTFTVTATNAVGTGNASTASLATTTLSVPTTPSIISVATASGQATVSFTAATSDPLVPITSYKVTSSTGQFNTGSGSPITITGLTNGSSYTFTVIATNTMGDSAGGVSSLITLPIYDPYFSSVTVLINANTGSNGTNNFYDSSSNARAVTNAGANKIPVNTSTVKYGAGSINNVNTVGQGGVGYLTMVPTSTTTIGLSNNFTVEFWFWPNGAQGAYVGFCGNYMDPGYGSRSSWAIGYDNYGTGISCSCAFAAGVYGTTSTTTVTNNTWHHLAFVRNGSVFTMYIDGNSISSFTDARAIYDGGSNLEIGSYIQGGYRFNGYMDDFRITNGVARYTAAFNTNLPLACPTQ